MGHPVLEHNIVLEVRVTLESDETKRRKYDLQNKRIITFHNKEFISR